MTEVTVPRDDERDAVLIAAVHRVLIAHAPARMRDRLHARLARLLHGVAPREGEKRIRREHAPFRLLAALLERDSHGVHAVRLPAAHPEQAPLRRDRDRVGLDVLDAPPRELERLDLRVVAHTKRRRGGVERRQMWSREAGVAVCRDRNRGADGESRAREVKSLRNGVHRANAVAWEPVRIGERTRLVRRRLRLGHGRELDVLGEQRVALLLEPPAAHLPERARRRPRLRLQDAQVLGLALERREARLRVRRRDDDLVKHPRLAVRRRAELSDLLRHLLRDLAVERDDPAERADRVRSHRGSVRLEDVAAASGSGRDAARVGVLDDDARRVRGREVADARVRRLRVEVVVVAHLLAVV
eukprot:30542-Pelagococcus_subviridis.AAC.5